MLRHALISQIVQMLIMELSILQISYSSEMELEDDSPPASSPRMDRLSMRSESPETEGGAGAGEDKSTFFWLLYSLFGAQRCKNPDFRRGAQRCSLIWCTKM